MKRLLIVYPRFNEEINCTQIIEDEKGFVCYTDQKPLWLKEKESKESDAPDDYYKKNSITPESGVGIQTARCD